jgi:hypothetical protein
MDNKGKDLLTSCFTAAAAAAAAVAASAASVMTVRAV